MIYKWSVFWGLLTFVGILLTTSFYFSNLRSETHSGVLIALNSQMLRVQIWALFSILIIWLNSVFRGQNRHWALVFLMHLPVSFVWAGVCAFVFVSAYWGLNNLMDSQTVSYAENFSRGMPSSMFLGVLAYKIILTTNIALDYNKKYVVEQSRSKALEAQLAQAQLRSLKMQLQPHFLFNTLNSVSDLTLKDPRLAVTMIARLGDFLRMTIESTGKQGVSLERELDFLRLYLAIEKTRFCDALEVEFDVDKSVLHAKVPNLILQPIVENAIKHGVSKKVGTGRIWISASMKGDKVLIEVENDGADCDFDPNTSSRKGVGLTNTLERLTQLYDDSFVFNLESRKHGGAVVKLEIPFTKIAEETKESE